MPDYRELLRELPAVDRLLREPALEEALGRYPRRLVIQAVQETLGECRQAIAAAPAESEALKRINISVSGLAASAAALAGKKASMNLRPLINATGVVIHTNLGRVPLAGEAVEALLAVAGTYNNLELDLESGKRGSRQDHLESLLCELTGAEAAVVVNNNAAAVFLALNTLAAGREVVVSRGQLVEIGGSFRIPEIMASSGARLVEVGTTNKTYPRDYTNAVGESSVAFLKVHTSNFHLVGFTAEVGTAELAVLAHRHNLLLIEDLGSGALLGPPLFGLPEEPRVQECIAAGADLVTFSGDKLLGGPQAGLIVGRADLVAAIRSNQLYRVLRVDKFTVAALEATLRLYLDEDKAVSLIPVWKMLKTGPAELRVRAERLAERLEKVLINAAVSVVTGTSRVGGGALPAAELPTVLVRLEVTGAGLTPGAIADCLRRGDPPVILRLHRDSLLIDPRTVFEEEEDRLVGALRAAFGAGDLPGEQPGR